MYFLQRLLIAYKDCEVCEAVITVMDLIIIVKPGGDSDLTGFEMSSPVRFGFSTIVLLLLFTVIIMSVLKKNAKN